MKYPTFKRTTMNVNKHQKKLLDQTEARLNKETDKQVDLVYHAAAIALNRMSGWKQERIVKMVLLSKDVWDECGASNDLSMVQLCEKETGIDLRSEHTNTDYEDIIYLNSEKDSDRPMTIYEWIAMRQNQIKWVPSQITACVLMALHRKEGWGTERLIRFLNVFEYVKQDYDYDVKAIKKASVELTGFELLEEMI